MMTARQFANILVSVLGLYLCVTSLPLVIEIIWYGCRQWWSFFSTDDTAAFFQCRLGPILSFAFGVLLIFKSQWIAARWIAKDKE